MSVFLEFYEARKAALLHACPWCHALPGERCQVVGTSQELTKVPAHPSRLVATGKGAA